MKVEVEVEMVGWFESRESKASVPSPPSRSKSVPPSALTHLPPPRSLHLPLHLLPRRSQPEPLQPVRHHRSSSLHVPRRRVVHRRPRRSGLHHRSFPLRVVCFREGRSRRGVPRGRRGGVGAGTGLGRVAGRHGRSGGSVGCFGDGRGVGTGRRVPRDGDLEVVAVESNGSEGTTRARKGQVSSREDASEGEVEGKKATTH